VFASGRGAGGAATAIRWVRALPVRVSRVFPFRACFLVTSRKSGGAVSGVGLN
jgi:hypothetical protein